MFNNPYNLALFKVHCTAILFGATGIFGVLIESNSFVLTLARLLIAFAALALFFLIKKTQLQKLTLQEMGLQVLLGGLLTAHWVTFYIAVKVGGVAVGTLGFASFPAFVALFEMLVLKERLKIREFYLLTAITIGLILVTPEFEFGNQATQGLLWGILSGAVYAVLAILNRKNATKLAGSQASWWQYLFGAIILLPFAPQLLEVSAKDWFWLLCLGLLCTGVAYTLFVSSLNIINARTAAMIISLEPVYAILMAWLWLDEMPSLRMILGGSLIVFSVALVNLKK